MGGAERVARQHATGRLTVRERIERLFDPGTFHETGALAGTRRPTTTTASSTDFLPANMVVGQGRIDGRRGGRPGRRLHRPRRRRRRRDLAEDGLRRAARARPAAAAVRLVDGTGGGGSVKSLEQMGFTYVPALPGHGAGGREPRDRAGGGGRARAGGRARRRAGRRLALPRDRPRHRPAVRRRAAGGGGGDGRVARQGGRSAARAAQTARARSTTRRADEDDALEQLRRFLSYLPASVWELPPVCPPTDPRRPARGGAAGDRPARPAPALRDARASSRSSSTAARSSSSARRHGRSLITALARLDGRPVGVLASDPKHYGGGADRRRLGQARALRRPVRPVPPAGRQLRRPAGLRDRHRGRARRHDAPRRAGAVRRPPGDRAVGLGAGAQGLRRRGRRPRRRLAAEPALRVAVGRLGLAADRRRARGRLPARARGGRGSRSRCAPRSRRGSNAVRSPFRTAERFGVEEIIDPRDTRPLLCDWAARAHELVRYELDAGPKARGPRP